MRSRTIKSDQRSPIISRAALSGHSDRRCARSLRSISATLPSRLHFTIDLVEHLQVASDNLGEEESMETLANPEASAAPCMRGTLLGAASITLAVTLLRLMLELGKAPAWLAKRDAGGTGALIGIAWLPLVFGPWFAYRLRPGADSIWSLL